MNKSDKKRPLNSDNAQSGSAAYNYTDIIIKALQILSSETDLNQLLIKMMELLKTNSGADKIVLLLKNNENWSVQAVDGIFTKNTNTLAQQIIDLESIKGDLIPETVFNYFLMAKEEFVVENAEIDERFVNDNIIQTNKIKSIACIPIKSHGELVAIVYLENRKLENVFNRERMEFLKHLSSQFRISAENTLLYENLSQKVLQQRESEQKLRLVFENTNETIVVAQNNAVIYCNLQITELTGYSVSEVLSMKFSEFIHPHDLGFVLNQYQLRISGGLPKNKYSVRIITKKGQEKNIHVNSKLVNWDGSPATLSMITDITKLKKAELDLKRSENLFRELIQQSPLPIEILLPEGKIIHVNTAWKNLWQVNDIEAVETIGKYNMLTDPQIEKLGIKDEVKEAFKGKHVVLPPIQYDTAETSEDFDLKELKKFKSPWIQCHLSPVKDIKGKIIYIVNTYVDITDLKKAEKTINKSEERYRHLVEHSPLSIAILESDGKISLVNRAWKKHWGLSEEESIDVMTNYNILTDKQIESMGHMKLVERAFKGESVVLPLMKYEGNRTVNELGLKDMVADMCWIQTHLYPVKNKNGKIDSVVSINMDLTKLKEADNETQRQRDVIARIDRTSTMGQLTGSIAHELNQPLTGILSNAQAADLLLKSKHWDKEEIKEIFTEIISDTKRAGDVIRNLRELYKEQKIDHLPLEINTIIKEATKLLHSEVVMKHVAITTKFASSLPMIKGNRVQIQQVLVNLIINGIEAMSLKNKKDRKLLITTAADTSEVKVSVVDTGKGIDSDIIDRIFEPLATWKPDGTGMGLAISNTIIQAHGGSMFAKNRTNGGARVGFTIPVIKEKE